jgi:ATP-dependent helicase/nuclease subunit A
MSERVLVDAAARLAIRQRLDCTYLVEAAAGTGKTTELVARIVATLESGRGQLASIIAVTFTEKAAGEMKLRIRTELDRALEGAGEDQTRRVRLRTALAELEVAKISTIHTLCAELLREYPVEAGVDPAFEVADAQRSRRLLERAFDGWFERALENPPEGVRRVLQRRSVEQQGSSPRTQLFQAVMQRVDTRDFDAVYRRPAFDREAAVAAAMARLCELANLASQANSNSDPLARACARLGRELERARGLHCDALEALLRRLVRDREIWNDRNGRGKLYGAGLLRAAVLALRAEALELVTTCVASCDADLAACLSRELVQVVRAYEDEKASQGVLDFFDLLLLTRDLLRDHDRLRREIQARVTHVFVDEFQDTDPVQAEILLLMSASGSGPDAAERDPWRVRPVPGKLFLVGDPKQSIYRFRRADVSLYERVKAHLCEVGAELLTLVTSFRALPALQSFINAALAPVMAGQVESGQAAYVPLAAFRAPRGAQPAVIALPPPAPHGRSGRITQQAVNRSLPDAVAAFVEWLVSASGYHVQEHGQDVPVTARHVCLLFRRFRGYDGDVTRDYVRALEARKIAHVLSGGRSFHMREEVIALRAVVSALEWPDDALSVYATLRGPFAALSDDALLAFKTRTGHLHPFGPVDDAALEPAEREVAMVLALLAELHRARNRRPIAQTLSAFLHELRAHAGIAIWPTGEQALGNVLQVLDLARAYEGRGDAASFRGFVDWLDEHAELAAAADATVLEDSSDGVRVMTVHAAKGLEFPVVVLCDPTAPLRPRFASRYIDGERRLWAQALCDAAPIELLEQRERVRDQDEAEVVRLVYVAATRAREMLVVPACSDGPIDGWLQILSPALRPPADRAREPVGPGPRCPGFGPDGVVGRADHIPADSVAPGEHVPQVGEHRVVWWDPNTLRLERPLVGGLGQQQLLSVDPNGPREDEGLCNYQAWHRARAAARELASRHSLVARPMTEYAAVTAASAIEIAPALEILSTDSDRGARGGGARFGILVHQLLAGISPSEAPSDLERDARFFGRSLGAAPEEVVQAAAAVRAAIAHPLWQRVRAAAERGELFRETPVVLRTGDGTVLDGVVDLAFRERERGESHVVLVDFKTDAEIADIRAYAAQLALYAQALSQSLGEPVKQVLMRV